VTVPLSATSSRLDAARRFGDALRRAMARHQVGQKRLAKQAGVASSAVAQWRMGRNLPTLATAIRVAESLGDDTLVAIVREGRTKPCARCQKPFLHEGGGPKKYCSERCLVAAQKLRVGVEPDVPIDVAVRAKAMVADVVASLDELAVHQVAVLEFCRTCEPAGYCQTPACALRPVSPLPLAVAFREPDFATKAPGAWSPEHRERQLTAIREANAKRWARPGEREAQTELMRARHDAMTPEEHEAWVNRIRQSKARPVRVHAVRRKAS